jgi:pimeloyl-ACP methyl ester carboxylesterase
MWRPQLAHLSGRARVIAPDLRGFGQSDLAPTATPAEMAADVIALCGELGVETCTVVGLSMGGYVAMAMLAAAPRLCARLCLSDTRAEADTPAAAENRERAAAHALEVGPAALAGEIVKGLLGKATQAERPDLVREVEGLIASQRAEGFAAAHRGMARRPDMRPLLGQIAVPTAVLVGAEDGLTTPDTARAIAAGIPSAALEVLPRAGHLANLEAPAAWNAALDRLLERT